MVIPVLMYMGYKQIYLLGCDHNQLKNFNSTINNFYDEKLDVRYTKEKKKLNSNFLSLGKELNALIEVNNQYTTISNLAKEENVEIINLSQSSWIDIFKTKKLDKII